MTDAGYLLMIVFIFLIWIVVITAVIWMMSKIPTLIG